MAARSSSLVTYSPPMPKSAVISTHSRVKSFPDGQALGGVQAVDPLVIDVGILRAQHVVDHAVTPAPAPVGHGNEFLAQLHVELAWRTFMALGISA